MLCNNGAELGLAAALSKDNDLWDSWVLEYDFYRQLSQAQASSKPFILVDEKERKQVDSWSVKYLEKIPKDKPVLFNKSSLVSHSWLLPSKPNDLGFDAVYLVYSNGKWQVTFVNVTRSVTHTLNVKEVGKLVLDLTKQLRALQDLPLPQDQNVVVHLLFLTPAGVDSPKPPIASDMSSNILKEQGINWNGEVLQRFFIRTPPSPYNSRLCSLILGL
jgi:hypothetical protein